MIGTSRKYENNAIMKIKSILSALLLMVSSVASAQYLNVKMENGSIHSYKTTPNMKVSFGDKAGLELTESEQIVTVGNYKVTVKLADDTPANEVMLSLNVEEENVKIEAFSKLHLGLWCSTDDNTEIPVTSVSNGYYTFALSKSNITNDVVVTIGYIIVSFDLNNSGMNGNFMAKPEDTKIRYNATIKEPARRFSDKHGFRGWYKDKECTEAWNFSTVVTKSMTLYAKWTEDPTGNQINGHNFVKLAGYYWATENVSSDGYNIVYRDSTYGDYFNQCKGNTSDFDATDNNALNAAKSWCSEGNYSWTLPSAAQWQALIDYCNWEWKTDYDYNETKMNGYLVKGRDDTYELGHSIFLPAAGDYLYGDVFGQGVYGDYWSSTPYGSNFVYSLTINPDYQSVDGSPCDLGYSVRAVLAE